MNDITTSKDIFGGKPVIKGTRVSVNVISDYISAGYSICDIEKDYPNLTRKQIIAALKYLEQRAAKERTKIELQAC